MDTRLVALAIPFFFFLIAVEAVISRVQKVQRYRFHDTITSLGCGTGEQVIVVFTAGLSVVAYRFVEQRWAIAHIGVSSVPAWAVAFLVVDHSYYWFHRASHRVGFMWAGHAVHHQSEEYNLSTALRQNWIENLLAWPFYVPLAFVGFPFAMFATTLTLHTLYQFWIHTRIVKRLGLLEGVLNTPASHRVHHGIDPKYVDRNYGGLTMIWDRLYGTYQDEREEPVYGTVKPLASWNPLWANVDGWARLWTMSGSTARLRDKIWVWLAPPDWRPDDLGGPVRVPEVDRAAYRKFDTGTKRAIDRYVLSQFGVIALATPGIMWFASALSAPLLAVCSLWVLVALTSWGALFEGKKWGAPLEVLRHVGGIGIALAVARAHAGAASLIWAASASAVLSVVFLLWAESADRAPSGVGMESITR